MGLIELLTGWQEVPIDLVNKNIVKIAAKKGGPVVFVNGNTFKYKIVYPQISYAKFNGHEAGITSGSVKYYRKLKPIKKGVEE